MKKTNKPGNATPAPAKKAETKEVKNIVRNKKKEYEARSRARRMRSMLKQGMKEEQIQEMFAQENNRMILVLLNGNYSVQDGVKDKKVRHKDKDGNVSIEVVQVPNMLHGFNAAKKYIEDNGLHFMSGSSNSIWVLSDKDSVTNDVEKLKVLGRTSITKPEAKTEKKPKDKKPTNNTAEVKAAAKAARKKANTTKCYMRPFYAALRKGGVSARIKKHNPTLANKIEAWLKEHKKAEAEKADRMDKHKRDHRQMSSVEMKANKRVRKAAKHLLTRERHKVVEAKRIEANAKMRAARVQKAKKPVQTEIKAAA